MNIGGNIPSSLSSHVPTFNAPVGRLPVGQENPEARTTPLKPVIETNEAPRTDARRDDQALREADQRAGLNQRIQEEEEASSDQQQGGDERGHVAVL